MIGTRRVRHCREVRPPFIAHDYFEPDFSFVWGHPPLCCYCRRPVRGGQFVAFLRPMRPETLHRVACRTRDAEKGSETDS